MERQWSGMIQAKPTRSQWNTGLNVDLLKYIGAKSVDVPQDFVRILYIDFLFVKKKFSSYSKFIRQLLDLIFKNVNNESKPAMVSIGQQPKHWPLARYSFKILIFVLVVKMLAEVHSVNDTAWWSIKQMMMFTFHWML